MFIILGFYKFKNLKSLKRHKTILENLFSENDIRGTLIISKEGLNGTISGKYKNIFLTSKKIKSLFGIVNFDSENLSKSKFQPFHKPRIKIKKEVVPMGLNISAKNKKTNYVEPLKWNNLIKDKNTFVLDVRKPFEYEVGSFKKAVNPKVNHFREFPEYLNKLDKKKPVAMFCTGGIRCEKASAFLNDKGFKNIFQLKGGVLNYLKKINEFYKNQLTFGQVVFLGNSITEGGNDWGNRLKISNAVNRGIGGDTTLGIIGRIGEIKFFKPKAVFLLIGINDLWNNDPKTPSKNTIKKNILTIVKSIKKASPETKIFLQTILPTSKKIYNLKIKSINDFLKRNEQKSLYRIVDLYSIFVNDKGYIKEDLTTDGIHLNEKGYEEWTKFIKPLIKDL